MKLKSTKNCHNGLCISIILAMLCVMGCANPNYRKGRSFLERGQYRAAIEQLKLAEIERPNDWKIKRELGVAFYNRNQLGDAVEKFKEAFSIYPKNGRTLLYWGLSYEKKQRHSDALKVYRLFLRLSFLDPLRKELQARMRDIHLKELQQEVKNTLREIEEGKKKPIEPNTVAVLYFRNISNWAEIDPISKGIAEIMATDLSKVNRLRLVERSKLQVLLDELKLSTSEFIDTIESLKTGQILSASLLVLGGIERLSETDLQMNAGVVATETSLLRGDGAISTGGISQLLKMEKELVFDLIKDMGIRLTNEEIEAIRPLPTKNVLAFIAFSRGLDFEDKNLMGQAREQYAKAAKLDPKFKMAKQKLDELSFQRLSMSEIEKLVAYEELLSGTGPTVLGAGSQLGMNPGMNSQQVSPPGPSGISGFGQITVTGKIPKNN